MTANCQSPIARGKLPERKSGAYRLVIGHLPLAICLWPFAFGHALQGASVRAEEPKPRPVTVPLEVLKTKHLAIMVKVNGKGPYRMIFDTGAPLNLVSNFVAKESGMVGKDAKAPLPGLFGAMGQFPMRSLEVGSVKAENVQAVVMDHPALTALSRALGPVEGLIGFPFFARYTMTIDYQAKQLTLLANGYQPADILETLLATIVAGKTAAPVVLAPAAQWGIDVAKQVNDEQEGVLITRVTPGAAAAAAGLKAGDRLLAIDGRWTESVADCYRAAAASKAGTDVPVTIRRQDAEKKLTVRPRSGL